MPISALTPLGPRLLQTTRRIVMTSDAGRARRLSEQRAGIIIWGMSGKLRGPWRHPTISPAWKVIHVAETLSPVQPVVSVSVSFREYVSLVVGAARGRLRSPRP